MVEWFRRYWADTIRHTELQMDTWTKWFQYNPPPPSIYMGGGEYNNKIAGEPFIYKKNNTHGAKITSSQLGTWTTFLYQVTLYLTKWNNFIRTQTIEET